VRPTNFSTDISHKPVSQINEYDDLQKGKCENYWGFLQAFVLSNQQCQST